MPCALCFCWCKRLSLHIHFPEYPWDFVYKQRLRGSIGHALLPFHQPEVRNLGKCPQRCQGGRGVLEEVRDASLRDMGWRPPPPHWFTVTRLPCTTRINPVDASPSRALILSPRSPSASFIRGTLQGPKLTRLWLSFDSSCPMAARDLCPSSASSLLALSHPPPTTTTATTRKTRRKINAVPLRPKLTPLTLCTAAITCDWPQQ